MIARISGVEIVIFRQKLEADTDQYELDQLTTRLWRFNTNNPEEYAPCSPMRRSRRRKVAKYVKDEVTKRDGAHRGQQCLYGP